MKYCHILSRNIVMENPDSPFRYFGWPTVTRLKNGRLATVASGFRLGHVCPFGKVVMSYSDDEGATWTRPTVVLDTPLDDRDAGVAAFGDRGLIVTSFTNSMEFQRWWTGMRKDNVTRMTDPKEIAFHSAEIAFIDAYTAYVDTLGTENRYYGSTYRISSDNGVTFGDVRLSPVTAPHGPAVTPDGRLLYVGKTFSDMVHPAAVDRIECHEILPDGTMAFLGVVPSYSDGKGKIGNYEPHAIVLESGKILVHTRVERHDGDELYATTQSVSTDGGKTFSEPRLIAGDTVGAPAHLLRHSSGLLLSSVGHRNAPFGIRILVSADDGETWEERILTCDAPASDLGYPATVELSDGSLYTVWYQNNQERDEGDCSRIYGAHWTLD